MHRVASCFVPRSNSVTKTRPFAMMGDESPDPIAVFQSTFWLGPNSTGGLPSPIPDEFGPLNCGHSPAPAKLDRTTVATTMIQKTRVMQITLYGLCSDACSIIAEAYNNEWCAAHSRRVWSAVEMECHFDPRGTFRLWEIARQPQFIGNDSGTPGSGRSSPPANNRGPTEPGALAFKLKSLVGS